MVGEAPCLVWAVVLLPVARDPDVLAAFGVVAREYIGRHVSERMFDEEVEYLSWLRAEPHLVSEVHHAVDKEQPHRDVFLF